MPWEIRGRYLAPCSCNVGCPCLFGELDADRGWCSGTVALDIQSGEVDGVDVSGTSAVLVADWPRGFLAGDGTGRLYLDADVSEEQQSALEPVLGGQRGGVFEGIAGLISNLLPTKRAAITFTGDGDDIRFTVDGVGEGVFTPLRAPSGEATRVLHGAAAFRDDTLLGKGTGTRFHDPDMREWESGGHSESGEFDWTG